jgi:excisionase family DNA binding protein
MAKKKPRKIMPIDLEEMVTLPDAAKIMDVAESYVRKLVREKRVVGLKFGRNYLVSRQSASLFKKKPGYGRPKSS